MMTIFFGNEIMVMKDRGDGRGRAVWPQVPPSHPQTWRRPLATSTTVDETRAKLQLAAKLKLSFLFAPCTPGINIEPERLLISDLLCKKHGVRR